MSTVNTAVLNSDTVSTNNLTVGNASGNIAITANTTVIGIGANVFINSTAVFVGNATVNTTINATALTTNSITINSVTTNTINSTQVLDYQVFTTVGWSAWTKPAGATANDLVTIMLWGGGGGHTGGQDVGGGGGACVIINKLASECNATCNVYVANGGLSNNTGTAPTSGEDSVFWANSTFSITAYGGACGNAGNFGGGGGGWFSKGTTLGVGGGPLGAAAGTPGGTSTFGGGGGASTSGNGGPSVYGGGGGSQGSSGVGGNSIFGGGGGAALANGGVSIFGGNGGNSSVAPGTPGGGGGGRISGGGVTNGARGEVRVWVYRVG